MIDDNKQVDKEPGPSDPAELSEEALEQSSGGRKAGKGQQEYLSPTDIP